MLSENSDFKTFADLVNTYEKEAKAPKIFSRPSENEMDELCILRRWNSHTPVIIDGARGGGYLLRWQGKGTVIDPGCSFIQNFTNSTNYNLDDIDMVIVTHDHVDHCHDFSTLVSLFRQFNKWRVETECEIPRVWDMVISYGVAEQFISVLTHPDNAPFIFWRKVLANVCKIAKGPQDVPKFYEMAQKAGTIENDAYLKSYYGRATQKFSDNYSYNLEVLPTRHKELLGASTAFGLKFSLKQKQEGSKKAESVCKIVISGDTALGNKDERKRYNDSDLLVLHVGGIGNPGEKKYVGEHLCFDGVVEILRTTKKNAMKGARKTPKLVVLTEWGYEFCHAALNGRTKFTQYVADELNREFGQKIFHAAVADETGRPSRYPRNAIVILPADIGLRISLPELKVFTSNGTTSGFWEPDEIYAKEIGGRIDYLHV